MSRECMTVRPVLSALLAVALATALASFAVPAAKDKTATLSGTRHDLSVTGIGPKSSRSNPCIFCHTPHEAESSASPLWNRGLPVVAYNTYISSTYDAGPAILTGSTSKLCLTCHDGTIAPGSTKTKGNIPVNPAMQADTVLGTHLVNDHPVGITPVDDGQLAAGLFQIPPVSNDPAVELRGGRVECTSCHNPHDPSAADPVAGKFLVRSNSGGGLCLSCHEPGRSLPNSLNGWGASAHATSSNSVPTTSPFAPYGNVSANACGNCHLAHNTAESAAERLIAGFEEAACASCHNGMNVTPAIANVLAEFSVKTYVHPTVTDSGQHEPRENAFPLSSNRHAECVDCHQPHRARIGPGNPVPPAVEPALVGASGFSGAGPLQPAANEYEVCFKCHSTSSNKPQGPGFADFGRIPDRLSEQIATDPHDLLAKFGSPAARHNVVQARRLTATQVPSLRANMVNLNGSAGGSLAVGTYIYCTDCHSNNQARKSQGSGPNGPHGSDRIHLLERRYDLEPPPAAPGGNTGGVPYVSGVNGSAGICYKCHDIDNSTLRDASFREHDKHVRGEDASCATCHEPHGVQGGNTVNNHSLIDFDLSVVGPSSSGQLRFERTGTFSGRCYLTCHGQNHNPESY